MRNENDVYIDAYQSFIQKIQQIDINLNSLQQGYEKKLRDNSNENQQNLKNKINNIISLRTTLSSFCEKISSSLFDNILDEIRAQLFKEIQEKKVGHHSEFFYKTKKSIDFLDQINQPSENFKELIILLNEIYLTCTSEADLITNAIFRLKHHLVLTAIEKQEFLELDPFLDKKLQLGRALKEYCFKVAEQTDYCANLISLTKQFLNDPNNCLTPVTEDLLKTIYNKIMNNPVRDAQVTGLIEEMVGEELKHPQKTRKRLFTDDEDKVSLSKSPKTNYLPSPNSPPGISLSDLADVSTNSVKQLPEVTFKPPKKRLLEQDASDEEDNESRYRPVK